jgi:hypothetical protein
MKGMQRARVQDSASCCTTTRSVKYNNDHLLINSTVVREISKCGLTSIGHFFETVNSIFKEIYLHRSVSESIRSWLYVSLTLESPDKATPLKLSRRCIYMYRGFDWKIRIGTRFIVSTILIKRYRWAFFFFTANRWAFSARLVFFYRNSYTNEWDGSRQAVMEYPCCCRQRNKRLCDKSAIKVVRSRGSSGQRRRFPQSVEPTSAPPIRAKAKQRTAFMGGRVLRSWEGRVLPLGTSQMSLVWTAPKGQRILARLCWF